MIAAAEGQTRETRHRAREIKFVTDVATYPKLVDWALRHLAPDGHGTGAHGDEYATSTLYLDTRAFDVYNRRRSYGRSKYRIRRYGLSDAVFLERKFRTERLLAKRRTLVPLSEIHRLAGRDPDPAWTGRWFHRRILLRELHPLVQLSYERVARVGTSTSGPVRLTIDRRLSALPLPDFAFIPGAGAPFLTDACIVEVKYQVTLPGLFKELAEAFCLDVQKISKFRAALRALDYPLAPDVDEEVPHTLPAAGIDSAGVYAD
jgi:hypothetical protein